MVRSESKRAVRTTLRARRRERAAGRDLEADAEAIAALALDLASGLELPLDPAPAPDGPGDGRALAPAQRPVVLSYESLPHEPPTGSLNAALVAAGWQVLVPITLPDLDLDWCDLTDRVPLGTDTPARADLALIPGLAVDHRGTRLGQGGGCYDRVLPRLRPGTPVAVLLHPGEHTSEALPCEPHDQPVPTVLTAEGITSSARG